MTTVTHESGPYEAVSKDTAFKCFPEFSMNATATLYDSHVADLEDSGINPETAIEVRFIEVKGRSHTYQKYSASLSTQKQPVWSFPTDKRLNISGLSYSHPLLATKAPCATLNLKGPESGYTSPLSPVRCSKTPPCR